MNTVVMVHGAFCGGWAFDRLRASFEDRGWRVLTPDLRGHAASDPVDAVGGASMVDYAADVAALCGAQPEPPVLVGHSMGGLVAQMAARRTPLAALVLFAPSAPWGVPGFSMEEAVTAFGVQVLSPFASVVEPDAAVMRAYSLDRLNPDEASAVIARMRPESARALRETLNWWLDPFMTTSLGQGPLPVRSLALVGEHDRVHPPSTVRETARLIGAELRVLPKMSHWPFLEGRRDDVTAEVLRWLDETARAAA